MSELFPIKSRYFDPTTDFGFKKLFGEEANKDLLMDFFKFPSAATSPNSSVVISKNGAITRPRGWAQNNL